MSFIIGAIIVIAIIYGIIQLIIFLAPYIATGLLVVLIVGSTIGLLVGIFYGFKSYLLAIKDNINNKILKVIMMFITSVLIMVLLGGAVYFNPIEQIINNPPTIRKAANKTPVNRQTPAPSETWTNMTVNRDRINVRAGPSESHAIRFTLPRGTVVRVSNRDRSGDWVKINHNNREGFVHRSLLLAPETWTNMTVNRDRINVRAGPSENHAIRFTLPRGTVVRVSDRDRSGEWVKINHNNREGFVHRSLLR